MRSPREFWRLALVARMGAVAIAAATAAACSGPNVTLSGARVARAVEGLSGARVARAVEGASCPSSVVYVVSGGNRAIEIYDPANLSAGPCGIVNAVVSPQGLFVDSKGNLWVADAAMQQVLEFKPGSDQPARTLKDPYGTPLGVTIDEKSGNIYVTEYQNNNHPNTLVEVYAKGSKTPTASLGDPNARNGGYPAVDNQGNLYVTFMTQANKAQVDRWTGGVGTPQNLGLKLISAGGIVTTASGALAVCDPFWHRCGEFDPGSTTMTRLFALRGRQSDSDKQPILMPQSLALDSAERRAYVTSNSLTSWRFPGPDRLPIDQIDVPGNADQGVAVSPASAPGAPY